MPPQINWFVLETIEDSLSGELRSLWTQSCRGRYYSITFMSRVYTIMGDVGETAVKRELRCSTAWQARAFGWWLNWEKNWATFLPALSLINALEFGNVSKWFSSLWYNLMIYWLCLFRPNVCFIFNAISNAPFDNVCCLHYRSMNVSLLEKHSLFYL